MLLKTVNFTKVIVFVSTTMGGGMLALLLDLTIMCKPVVVTRCLPCKVRGTLSLVPLMKDSASVFEAGAFHVFKGLV